MRIEEARVMVTLEAVIPTLNRGRAPSRRELAAAIEALNTLEKRMRKDADEQSAGKPDGPGGTVNHQAA